MKTSNLTPEQTMIKDAVLDAILAALLCGNKLIPLLLSSREIIKVFRLSAKDLSQLRESGLIPTVRIKRSYRYNPADILELILYKNMN